MSRSRILAVGVGALLMIVAGLSIAFGSSTAGCNYPAPSAILPDALRAQGGFDQVVNATDAATLDNLAQTAATLLHPDLVGVSAAATVTVHAPDSSHPDAVIVPLEMGNVGATKQVAALAVFLTDCDGRLHYSSLHDLGAARVAAFPSVSEPSAVALLGPGAQLVYTVDPLRPVWRSSDGARQTPAV